MVILELIHAKTSDFWKGVYLLDKKPILGNRFHLMIHNNFFESYDFTSTMKSFKYLKFPFPSSTITFFCKYLNDRGWDASSDNSLK